MGFGEICKIFGASYLVQDVLARKFKFKFFTLLNGNFLSLKITNFSILTLECGNALTHDNIKFWKRGHQLLLYVSNLLSVT